MSVDASNFCFSGKIVRIAPLEWNSMYHQLADGKTPGLKWKCIERRSPTPTPSENNTVTDTTVDQTPEIHAYDFEDDAIPQTLRSINSQHSLSRNSAKKEKTQFTKVVEMMRRSANTVGSEMQQKSGATE